jgi:hypothetical protein
MCNNLHICLLNRSSFAPKQGQFLHENTAEANGSPGLQAGSCGSPDPCIDAAGVDAASTVELADRLYLWCQFTDKFLNDRKPQPELDQNSANS